MIGVVLDTNVVVSALLQPHGPPARLFLPAVGGSIQMCVSFGIYEEEEEVLRRLRLKRIEGVIVVTLRTIRVKGYWIRPSEAIRVCDDPDDDIFLECAAAANADYLVTGNARHFPSAWKNTRVVAPRAFLEVLSGGSGPNR